jgi:2-iminobutanoate/2-iminopropanoate deaminase
MDLLNIPGAPEAIGPYSHAVQFGDLIFCSGQTPINPETGDLVGDEIQTQTTQALANLVVVLNGLGLGLQNIVKTTVFLKNMGDFAGMNEVYAATFGDHRPARTTVAVCQNPLDALVEIECIAAVEL